MTFWRFSRIFLGQSIHIERYVVDQGWTITIQKYCVNEQRFTRFSKTEEGVSSESDFQGSTPKKLHRLEYGKEAGNCKTRDLHPRRNARLDGHHGRRWWKRLKE
jgi:hypothetical protein